MSKQQPKKRSIDPQAAKILEQYRSAKSGLPAGSEEGGAPVEGNGAAQRTNGAPAASQVHRSGTRGK